MADLTEEEIRNAYRAMETSRKMLTKRGYIVPDLHPVIATYEKFKQAVEEGGKRRSELSYLAEKPSKSNENDMELENLEKIWVMFTDDKKIGIDDFKKIHERVSKSNATRAILVLDTLPSAFVRTAMENFSEKYKYEVFRVPELLVDITEHELVPLHEVLTEEEKKTMLKRYNLRETQLPRMLLTDPISRYYGLTRGQVVKIIRASETAGRYVTYRIVL